MTINRSFGCVMVSLSLFMSCVCAGPITMTQTPPPPPPPPRNRLITWLRNLAGVRQTQVAIYPDGKIAPGDSIEFRWSVNSNIKPDHFKIRVFEKNSATDEQEVWTSDNIGGNLRSLTATLNLNNQPNRQYSWKIEMYDANTTEFSVQTVQPFSFTSESDLKNIRQRETTMQGWIQERPEDKHLLLLLGTFYARVGMNSRARDLFIQFLEANQIAFDSNPSYKEVATPLYKHLESVQAELARTQLAYNRSRQATERRQLLEKLLSDNLTLLEYGAALVNLNALLGLTHNDVERMTLERRRQSLAQEESLAQDLFVASSNRNHTRDSWTDLENATSMSSGASSHSLHSHSRSTTGTNRFRNPTFSITLDPYKAAWYTADNEILGKYPKPGGRKVQPTYFAGEEAGTLIEGLRQGNILLGVQDQLGREMLRRAVLNLVVKLATLKRAYMSSAERTPTLDASWAVIPEARSLTEDMKAFGRFARIIYPAQKDIGMPEVMDKRDELVRYLERKWTLPAGDLDDDKFLEQKLFHDILLYRLSPVLVLKRTGGTMPRLDTIEIVNEGFSPIDGIVVAGPPEQAGDLSFRLNGACPGTVSKKIDTLRLGVSKAFVIRVESKQKGSYRVRFRLKNRARTIWESSSIGLYFI